MERRTYDECFSGIISISRGRQRFPDTPCDQGGGPAAVCFAEEDV